MRLVFEDLFDFVIVLPAFWYSGRSAYLYTAAFVHLKKWDHFLLLPLFGISFDTLINLC